MPPRRVGPYEILSVIGRGGIGTVYRARHGDSGRVAAVKVLGPAPAVDATAARRLAREYEVLRTLDHPNVVRVYDAGVYEGYSFLAMELVDGLDLRAYLSPALDATPALLHEPVPSVSEDGAPGETHHGAEAILALAAIWDEPETDPEGLAWTPPSRAEVPAPPARRPPLPPEAREVLNRPLRVARLRAALSQVCSALEYVHARGLVHRDLKPTNIMVDGNRVTRIMDFGLVKAASEAHEAITQTGRIVGTYRYMSPEQAQGQAVDARSDLYSLGVMLYELLTGVPPFTATEPAGLWREILTARPPPVFAANPGAEATLAGLAERLMEKDPAHRPQSAREVLGVLKG